MPRLRKRKARGIGRRLRLESLESRTLLHGQGVLSGAVYFDTDGDGTRDDSELGIPGVVVRLSEANSTDASRERSTITDDNGDYTFDELDAGTYEISKRQAAATIDGQDSTSVPGAVSSDNLFSNVVLADDDQLSGNNFGERGLRPDFISVAWFFASAPPARDLLRETIALSEELAGDSALAASIREGATDVPGEMNHTPVAADDVFSIEEDGSLTRDAAAGVLANDVDADGDLLTATLVDQASDGFASISSDGSFTYTPDAGFSGSDSFTYTASDGTTTSNEATVRVNVTSSDNANQPFGPVTEGSFDDPGLLGTRTDLVAGAPAITAAHVNGDIDYTGYSNPPTYGDHHGSDPDGTDSNPGITPRPTGIYTTEQPDEDLIHNLEHGHVWISYNPGLISANDRTALEQLVLDGSPNANGSGVGVILTPRAANDKMIALASWARLQTLDNFDPTAIRNFVESNRGKAPEGFITP